MSLPSIRAHLGEECVAVWVTDIIQVGYLNNSMGLLGN